MKFGLRKRERDLDASIVTGDSGIVLVDAQMNYNVSCVNAQWFSHWKIKADDHDVMK